MNTISVSTPSRLHFGLLRLHETAELSYGGLGLMIDRPRVELDVTAAPEWDVTGPAVDRATEFGKRALAKLGASRRPEALRICIRSNVPAHRGLGGGTQLGLAIAASVRQLAGLPLGTAVELAAAVGRGARSAVGSHGFLHGGLIWERGRPDDSPLSPLTDHAPLPAVWRVVLVGLPDGEGLSGDDERRAFSQLPNVPAGVSSRLEALAEGGALPAARTGDLAAFGEAVHEYGRIAGECFGAVQGGPYATPLVAELVEALRACGGVGVGQSSWGPTVFAFTPDKGSAAALVTNLRKSWRGPAFEATIAAADNRGAIIECRPECSHAPLPAHHSRP
jgi:beta-ribofuranosylaminobenzene 5'-phosphate synthase